MTKINITYDRLCRQLDDWYRHQPFEVLDKIHGSELYDFIDNEELLDKELDYLMGEWEGMSIDEKYFNYNQFRGIYDYK